MTDRELERMVERHLQAVYAFLAYRTRDHELAEDLLGDTLERAFKARARFTRSKGSERAWLISIALNALRDHARKTRAETAALERIEPVSAPLEADVIVARQSLLTALGRLPADEAEAIALVYGADLTARQAARVLQVPVTTVQGRVARAQRRLRDLLSEAG